MAQRQRKGGSPPGGGGNTVFYIVLGVIALVGVLALGYALTGGRAGMATEPVDLQLADARALYERAAPIRLGAEDAPVTIRDFSDYQCPACSMFALQVLPVLKNRYLESGDVQFHFHDFPLVSIHAHAFLAARAARCAGDQDRYWEYHDRLFVEQSSWSPRANVTSDFVRYASDLGLNARDFERCLRSDRHADVVTANMRLGEQLRITGTPTILVNNRRVANWNAAGLTELIEEALEGR